MAAKILMEVSKDEEARAYYESELIFELDQIGRYNQAKREGIEQTEEKYEAEKIESVKIMLEMGDSVEKIAKVTKYSIDRVENIKKEFDL